MVLQKHFKLSSESTSSQASLPECSLQHRCCSTRASAAGANTIEHCLVMRRFDLSPTATKKCRAQLDRSQAWYMACCEHSDVIIQASHQSQCYRIVQYHQDRTSNAFPNNGFGHKVSALVLGRIAHAAQLCSYRKPLVQALNHLILVLTIHACQAIELGPRSNKSGPCLVLLQVVTVTLTAFLAWWTTSHIRRYCPRLFWLGSLQVSVETKVCSQPCALFLHTDRP